MNFTNEILQSAHNHCFQNRDEILKSEACACFYCLSILKPEEIQAWVNDHNGKTALCPNCGIDSLIGSHSGFPIEDIEFLKAMNDYFF